MKLPMVTAWLTTTQRPVFCTEARIGLLIERDQAANVHHLRAHAQFRLQPVGGLEGIGTAGP